MARPPELFPFFAEVETLKGVGPRVAALIEKATGGRQVRDLLWHFPTGLVDRRQRPTVAEAQHGAVATLCVQVDEHRPGRTPRQPYRVYCSDQSGTVVLTWFHARADWLERLLPVGQVRLVSGRVELFDGQPQMSHPDYVLALEDAAGMPDVEPVYGLTAGLAPRILVKSVQAGLATLQPLPEWQAMAPREGWPGFVSALAAIHAPLDVADLGPLAPARARLAFDELLANQVAMALLRRAEQKEPAPALPGTGKRRARTLDALPFALTGAQARAGAEIAADLGRPERMLRLLQGDVGSGKTIVAFLAALQAIESGTQVALLAPTEILARQHAETLAAWATAAGVRVALLTGRDKGKARSTLLAALADGVVDLIVGTHALLEEDVRFAALGLAIVDEQHRFGVDQRLALASKGTPAAHLLVMSATPIPRTLTLTLYGDMDVSRLDEKPPGRSPVDTRALPLDRLDEVVAGVERATARGARVFWVCPLVEESDEVDATAAQSRAEMLAGVLRARVGLIHGRMKSAEKDAAMQAFAGGETQVLVATTVIEVGVNVPEATLMVIEHAERFGLAQLHQLRGRVGRGAGASVCLLLYQAPLGEVAAQRLRALRDSDDGFVLAEADLKLRGGGEILGTRQSGLPAFRLADLAHHAALIPAARAEAQEALRTDPDLTGPRGQALRMLLALFERDAAERYLASG
ncbi:ATP-dependent DNA helicase RecG [Zavarzinia sp. CC-PAN008]|uniref:ATP-dependent DNA helicase RecG n=1 Tax=Zavarzinia sp. CC-PAN008 TaxID=3243332 RepID=UPI003F74989E